MWHSNSGDQLPLSWSFTRNPAYCGFMIWGCASATTIFIFYYWLSLGQRLCIDFSVPVPANFLTTLRSHLDVTCSCYFWFSLRINVMYSCSFSWEKTEPQGILPFSCFVLFCRLPGRMGWGFKWTADLEFVFKVTSLDHPFLKSFLVSNVNFIKLVDSTALAHFRAHGLKRKSIFVLVFKAFCRWMYQFLVTKILCCMRGFTPGLYHCWGDCEREVRGYSDAEFQCFKSEETEQYLRGC